MSPGWVCPECGLDYDTVSPSDAVVAIRSFARRYRELLEAVDDDKLRVRPEPDVWSALEYTAHVADVFDSFVTIVHRVRAEDHPRLPDDWDPDERARSRRYNEQAVQAVLADLAANATRLADEVAEATPDDLRREATFDYGERDLLTMIRNAVHEGAHHRRDVERVLRQVDARDG